jgi:hypothetical protein
LVVVGLETRPQAVRVEMEQKEATPCLAASLPLVAVLEKVFLERLVRVALAVVADTAVPQVEQEQQIRDMLVAHQQGAFPSHPLVVVVLVLLGLALRQRPPRMLVLAVRAYQVLLLVCQSQEAVVVAVGLTSV